MAQRSVVTIGTFDGVHAGHVALVRRARTAADAAGARVVAMAFDPHPSAILRPESAPPRLTTFGQRERLLRIAGADHVERLEPTPALLGRSASDFLESVGRAWSPAAFVEGPDFRFGKGRAGDIAFMREFGAKAGFTVEVVEPVTVALSDHTVVPASSTLARWLIAHGRMGDAARVLTRPYEIEGIIVRGDRRGRTIGFPTANIQTECLLPADGVYAGSAMLADGRAFAAAVSVGTKPTFDGVRRALEVFLIDAPGDGDAIDGLPEYGWPIQLRIQHWVREQVRFASVASLVEQMHRDIVCIRGLMDATMENAACR
jgi:riboflavin kinase/FMN adenylyltransferase